MIIKRTVPYSPTNETRTLHIYLPEGYEESEERYPVMYMFDGHNLFSDEDATYGKSWGMKDFLDSWSKKIIVVGVECSHIGNHRLLEYCPYSCGKHFGEELNGTGNETMDWWVNELKPMIDHDYRTYSHREATGIGGSSMGGLMSVYAGIKYNEVFSKCACISSSIGICMDQLLEELNGKNMMEDSKFFLSWGEHEGGKVPKNGLVEYDTRGAKLNRWMAQELNDKGCMSRIFFQKDGYHSEASWEKEVPYFMNYLWRNR